MPAFLSPRRPPRALVILSAALAAVVLAAACGGGPETDHPPGPEADPAAVLERALSSTVESADVRLDAEASFSGLRSLRTPVRLEAAGTFVGPRRGAPAATDLDAEVGVRATGQTIQTGLISVARRSYVKFGGEVYEQPPEQARRLVGGRGTSLSALGLRPRTWISDPRDRGEEEIAGVPTDHVSVDVDVRRMLGDLQRVARRSSMAPRRLDGRELDRLASYVTEPTLDVYAGRRDGALRRLSLSFEAEVPEARRPELGGVEGMSFQMTLELSRVGAGQRVEAPARARPLADLARQLGGLRALRSGVSETLGGDRPRAPDPARTTPEAAGDLPEADDDPRILRRYSDCLDRARPSDTDALDRCGDLLR